MRLLISSSAGSFLAIDHCPPVENIACFVNGLLVHIVSILIVIFTSLWPIRLASAGNGMPSFRHFSTEVVMHRVEVARTFRDPCFGVRRSPQLGQIDLGRFKHKNIVVLILSLELQLQQLLLQPASHLHRPTLRLDVPALPLYAVSVMISLAKLISFQRT